MTAITRYVLSNPERADTTAGTLSVFGKRMEIVYFLAFAYLRLLPNFGIYFGGGTAGLSMLLIAGVIMYKQARKLSSIFYASIFYPVIIVGFIWFITIIGHPGFFQRESFWLISRLIWPAEAIIVAYLSRRPGFIKRLLLMMFLSTLVVMSFARFSSDKTQRLQLATNGFLANSNDFASWTGFVAVCLGMWAFNNPSAMRKILLMVGSGICIGLIALTVSRASMSLALATLGTFIILQTFIFRPRVSNVLTLMAGVAVVGLMILVVGIDGFIESYSSRANEDSGRERLWGIATEVVLDNPLGTGSDTVYDPGGRHYISPHNVFLFLGLIAGWIPIVLVICYYITCAIRMPKIKLYDGFLWMPGLLAYCILQHNQSNGYIFQVWTVIALTLCILPPLPEKDEGPTPSSPKPVQKNVFYNMRHLDSWKYRPQILNRSDSV